MEAIITIATSPEIFGRTWLLTPAAARPLSPAPLPSPGDWLPIDYRAPHLIYTPSPVFAFTLIRYINKLSTPSINAPYQHTQ